MPDELIIGFGLLVPINLRDDHGYTDCPISKPDGAFIVDWGNGWGVLYPLAEEEGCAPEAVLAAYKVAGMVQERGRRDILPQGFQFGAGILVSYNREGDGVHGLPEYQDSY